MFDSLVSVFDRVVGEPQMTRCARARGPCVRCLELHFREALAAQFRRRAPHHVVELSVGHAACGYGPYRNAGAAAGGAGMGGATAVGAADRSGGVEGMGSVLSFGERMKIPAKA